MLVGYLLDYDHSVNTELYKILVDGDYLRDRPFNLKGGRGYGFLYRSEIVFRTTQELEYIFFVA